MAADEKDSRFYYQVLAFYALSWMIFLTHFRMDVWLAIAIPVTLTYCGFLAHTMFVHGKIGTSADVPALPAAVLVMLMISGIFIMTGWIEWSPDFIATAITRFGTTWIGSHIILLLIAIVADKLGWG